MTVSEEGGAGSTAGERSATSALYDIAGKGTTGQSISDSGSGADLPRAGGLSGRIGAILALDPAAPAIESGQEWATWGSLAAIGDALAPLIAEPGTQVGILLRNTPQSVGMVLGVLRAGGCVVTINPGRGVERVREDIAGLGLPVLAGSADDLGEFVPPSAAATATLVSWSADGKVAVTPGGGGATAAALPGVAVRMLTSGTTGTPKRIELTYASFERVLVGAKHYETNQDDTPRLRSGVAVVNAPLVHIGGLFRVLQCVTDGRSFCLLDRFTVEGWVDAVRSHRPATASLVPTALRMVLEANVDPADIASLRSVVSGTAPLDPADADAFSERYGVPVLISYGATEFGGGVAGWNVADHRAFWATKRGSVGRAHAGCDLRIVDPSAGAPLPTGSAGLLEVRAAQLGTRDWVRTTDLARLDDDGFLWILGRDDQAIIRGGFKILPEDVKAALERHPAVRIAAVVGRPDRRLGAVPVALIEPRDPANPPTIDELHSHADGLLAPYEVPVEFRLTDTVPRTDSGKVDLAAVGAILAESESASSGGEV